MSLVLWGYLLWVTGAVTGFFLAAMLAANRDCCPDCQRP